MASQPYLTAPLKTDKMPPGIRNIVGNEAAERFNFYGMRAILFVFMTKYLVDSSGAAAPMSENEANKWYHLFLSANYFFPTIGAIISAFGPLLLAAGSFTEAQTGHKVGLAWGVGFHILNDIGFAHFTKKQERNN